MSINAPVPDAATKRAEPQSFRARAIAVSLTVKDLQKSLAWYRDVVGFTVDRKYEREGKVRADDGAKGWDRVKGEGFSLQLTTDQNLDEMANRIKTRGGMLESEPVDTPWGARIFRLRDPDRFRLTISSAPAA